MAGEISQLAGVSGLTRHTGHVDFDAPFDSLLSALLRLRSAQSLRLALLRNVAAGTFPMLFDQLLRVRWSLWLTAHTALQVRVRSRKSRLRDDAGLERALRQAPRHAGIETSSGGQLTLLLDLDHDRASVWLDLGGELHQRRGDKWVAATTIRETTAAALALLAGIAEEPPPDLLVDPFCGSGTIIIEALAILEGRAIGRERALALEVSPAWKHERWAAATRASEQRSGAQLPATIASDIDPQALRAAAHNLRAWGYHQAVQLRAAAVQTLDLAALARDCGAQRPLLLSNPPYGKEAQGWGEEPSALLRSLLGRAAGWRFALLSPHPGALQRLPGVTLHAQHHLITGGLANTISIGSVSAS